MKVISVFVLIVIIFVVSSSADVKYATRYDNFNVDNVLRNTRLLRIYLNCLKSVGPCTPEGSELKRILPDALETGCSKCNEKQKFVAIKVIKFLIHEKPQYWMELEQVYDPTGKYRVRYQKAFQEVAY